MPPISLSVGGLPAELTVLAPDVLRLRAGGGSLELTSSAGDSKTCGHSPTLTTVLPAYEPALVGRGVLTPPPMTRMPQDFGGALRTARPTIAAGEGRGEGERVLQPRTPHKLHHTAQRFTLTTPAGKFALNLRTGTWSLHDHTGLEIFRCTELSVTEQKPRLTLQLADGEAIFGLGESTGPLNKRGLIREFWNADVLGQASCIHPSLRNLYVSIPFALSLREGRAGAIFWDNPGRQTWDVGGTEPDEFRLRAATGSLDLYLFLGPTPADVVARFTELTGRMPLPPRWALGYQQSRYSYASRPELERVAREFRRRQIPCDALHLDIHHMDGHRVFTFGKDFPQPSAMFARLAKQGFKAVAIVDPGVKNDPQFGVLQRGVAQRAFVKAPGGKRDFIGKAWPGKSRFPDFLNARVRRWWAEEQAAFQRLGLDGIWNDMNEPALFDTPNKTLADGCVHQVGRDSVEPHLERSEASAASITVEAHSIRDARSARASCVGEWGSTESHPTRVSVPHAAVHNLYGSAMAAASREGALLAAPDTRPFILTRAGYAGIQRHAAVWTGDNSSTWEHLAESIPMLLNLSLSGVAFCGADVGGFLDHCTGELLARWTQLAAFTPFFRNHSNVDTRRQEPWAFGPRIEALCRDAIMLRYQMLPYLGCLFAEAHRSGTPIMRPLLWHHPNDPAAVACEDQFLLGESLLVAPILRPGATARSVYLPRGLWFDFWGGGVFEGGQHVVAEAVAEHIPVFVRAGAVVPTVAPRQFISSEVDSVVNLHVWPHGRSSFTWHEDDGETLGYERGEVLTRQIEFTDRGTSRELVLGAVTGAFASRVQTWRIVVRAAHRSYRVWVNDQRVETAFDPTLGVLLFEVPNSSEPLRVKWL